MILFVSPKPMLVSFDVLNIAKSQANVSYKNVSYKKTCTLRVYGITPFAPSRQQEDSKSAALSVIGREYLHCKI